MSKKWFPVTPGGFVIGWLASDTVEQAWAKLLADAAHMPYDGKVGFQERGYTVQRMPASMTTPTPPEQLYKYKG